MDDSSSLVLKHLLSDHALKARLSAAVASAAPLGSRRLGAAPRGTDDRGLSPLRPVRVRGCMGGRTVRGVCGGCAQGMHRGVRVCIWALSTPACRCYQLSVCLSRVCRVGRAQGNASIPTRSGLHMVSAAIRTILSLAVRACI